MFRMILLAVLLSLAASAGAAEDAAGYMQQGAHFFAEKQFDKAEQAFLKATELAPDSAKAWSKLGAFYLTQHKAEDAANAYQQAIINDPENPKYFVAMAISYLHQSEFAMAHAMANQALQLDPSMKNASKLAEYIDARQKVIEQASKADVALHQGVEAPSMGKGKGKSAAAMPMHATP